MKLRILVWLLCLVNVAFAQNGQVSGTVIEKETGQGLPGVKVEVVGVAGVGATTDFDGKFTVRNIVPGTYQFRFSAITYKTVLMNGVVVSAGKTTPVSLNIESAPATYGGDGVVIEATRSIGTIRSINEDKIKSTETVDAISPSNQKAPDTHLGEAAKRIPGVTVIDNRFVMVRGLSERYNAVLLNGVTAPSLESDVKAFSFDMVPSGMIDRFSIYKSPSPDLPGEFAGGAIRLTTKIIPDNTSLTIGYSGSMRTGTTFKDFTHSSVSSTDWLGYDDGMRALPNGFPDNVRNVTSNAQLQELGKSFTNPWSYSTDKASPDQRFSLVFTGRVSKPESDDGSKHGFQFGNITAINYSNTRAFYTSNRLDYNQYDTTLHKSDSVFYYKDRIYTHTARVGLLQNNAIRFGKDGRHKIELKNIFNQIGSDESTFRDGVNYEEGNYRKEYSYHYSQRSIYSGQLSGQHEWNKKRTVIDWTGGYSSADRSDPDWRRARYTKPIGSLETDPWQLYVPFAAQPFFLGRLYLNMNENIKAFAVNGEQEIRFLDNSKTGGDSDTAAVKWHFKVKAGAYVEDKEREFGVRNLGYAIANPFNFNWNMISQPIDSIFQAANIDTLRGLKIDEDTKKADAYTASNKLTAGYLMGVFPFLKEKLVVSGGVRLEHNIQQLHSYRTNGNDKVDVNNDILSVLPSTNFTYHFKMDKKDTLKNGQRNERAMLVRFGYGRTLNRPEFREIAPFYFYDFVFNSINTGNDSLKTPQIDNFDLRWEFFPTMNEIVSFGLFYKRFQNPIETYFVPGVGSGGTRSFTWGNAPEARSYGAEIDLRKSLSFTGVKFLEPFSISGNAALIKSHVVLTNDANLNTGVDNERPMMGQSPYIVNGGLYYQNDSIGLQVSLMYNVIGPRVVIVGIPGVPEVYEMPRHQLDLTIQKSIGRFVDVRLGCQDLLNKEFLLLQDANNDGKLDPKTDQRMQFYKRGSYYTLGISVKLADLKMKRADK